MTLVEQVCVIDSSSPSLPFPPATITVAEDAPTVLGLLFTSCIGGCARVTSQSCDIVVEGNDVTVAGSVTVTSRLVMGCGQSCLPAVATCVTDPLPAGNYTLGFGEKAMTFDVPYQGVSVCSL